MNGVPAGADGERGPAGPAGPAGPQGEAGPAGPVAELENNSVEARHIIDGQIGPQEVNFLGTLTNTKWCRFDGNVLTCDLEPPPSYDGGDFATSDQDCGEGLKVRGIDSEGNVICIADIDTQNVYTGGILCRVIRPVKTAP